MQGLDVNAFVTTAFAALLGAGFAAADSVLARQRTVQARGKALSRWWVFAGEAVPDYS